MVPYTSEGQTAIALVPALMAALLLSGLTAGTGGFILAAIVRAVGSRARRLSRQISRNLSDRLLKVAATDSGRRMVKFSKGISMATLLLGTIFARKAYNAMSESLSLMNHREEELDENGVRLLEAGFGRPKWGKGLKRMPDEWRALLPKMPADELLAEVHKSLGLLRRKPLEMTEDHLVEGVRRLLFRTHFHLTLATDLYWSEEQTKQIAYGLARENGMRMPLPQGGMEEVCNMIVFTPWAPPKWLQLSQRWGIASLRPIFLHVFGFESRFVETALGRMHLYDSGPPRGTSTQDEPPLLLQHGMFVTGWSMMLLAWLLARRGRRVVVPDLFDFDHGLSRSKDSPQRKIRNPAESVGALVTVIQHMLQNGSSQVDIAGHSFGGFLTGQLALRCAQEGIPVRKVVLLAPGGPPQSMHISAATVRVVADPIAAIAATPLPRPFRRLLRIVAGWSLSVFLSPNNINLLFAGIRHHEYFGSLQWASKQPTLLLWGDEDTVARPRPPASLGAQIKSAFPNGEAWWVHGGSHNVQLDSVVTIARVMHSWLSTGSAESRAHDSNWIEAALRFTRRQCSRMDFQSRTRGKPEATVSRL